MTDSLPLFLNLIKSHTLLYSFLLTGNLDSTLQQYGGNGYYLSESSLTLKEFALDSTHVFEYIQLTRAGTDYSSILFVAYDVKYVVQKDMYFGEKTIYHEVLPLIKEQGIELKKPNRYCFDFLDKKAGINLIGCGNLISVMYGDNVCQNFSCIKP